MVPKAICLTKRRNLGFQATVESSSLFSACTLAYRADTTACSCADLLAWHALGGCCHPPGSHWPAIVANTGLEGNLSTTTANSKWAGGQDRFSQFGDYTEKAYHILPWSGSPSSGNIKSIVDCFSFDKVTLDTGLASHRPLLHYTGTEMKAPVPGCQIATLITNTGRERMFLSLTHMMGTLKNRHLYMK